MKMILLKKVWKCWAQHIVCMFVCIFVWFCLLLEVRKSNKDKRNEIVASLLQSASSAGNCWCWITHTNVLSGLSRESVLISNIFWRFFVSFLSAFSQFPFSGDSSFVVKLAVVWDLRLRPVSKTMWKLKKPREKNRRDESRVDSQDEKKRESRTEILHVYPFDGYLIVFLFVNFEIKTDFFKALSRRVLYFITELFFLSNYKLLKEIRII